MRSSGLRNMPEKGPRGKSDSALKKFLASKGMPLVLIAAAVYGAYVWLLSDVGGEYYGTCPKLGRVELTINKDDKGISGSIRLVNTGTLDIEEGSVDGSKVELAFSSAAANGNNALWDKVIFVGQSDGDTLSGTLSRGSNDYRVKLKRTAASVMFRRLWWQR